MPEEVFLYNNGVNGHQLPFSFLVDESLRSQSGDISNIEAALLYCPSCYVHANSVTTYQKVDVIFYIVSSFY